MFDDGEEPVETLSSRHLHQMVHLVKMVMLTSQLANASMSCSLQWKTAHGLLERLLFYGGQPVKNQLMSSVVEPIHLNHCIYSSVNVPQHGPASFYLYVFIVNVAICSQYIYILKKGDHYRYKK